MGKKDAFLIIVLIILFVVLGGWIIYRKAPVIIVATPEGKRTVQLNLTFLQVPARTPGELALPQVFLGVLALEKETDKNLKLSLVQKQKIKDALKDLKDKQAALAKVQEDVQKISETMFDCLTDKQKKFLWENLLSLGRIAQPVPTPTIEDPQTVLLKQMEKVFGEETTK